MYNLISLGLSPFDLTRVVLLVPLCRIAGHGESIFSLHGLFHHSTGRNHLAQKFRDMNLYLPSVPFLTPSSPTETVLRRIPDRGTVSSNRCRFEAYLDCVLVGSVALGVAGCLGKQGIGPW